jgi:hypothetical protein
MELDPVRVAGVSVVAFPLSSGADPFIERD